MSARLRRWLPALLPFTVLVVTGLIGLDFGYHWDEPKLLESVRTGIYSGTLLPTFYNYPAVSHDLTLLAALPEIISNFDTDHLGRIVFQAHIAAYQLDSLSFQLRVRTVFLLVSALGIIWVYGAVLIWRESVSEALLGACLLAFSWEFAYHARWIAPDAIMAQFGALALMSLLAFQRWPEKRRWLWLAATAAGLATGTKYPGGLLLLPVLIGAYQATRSRRIMVTVVLVFAAAYLASTPGTLLQPFRFIGDVQYEVIHYRDGHSNHTVTAGFEHLSRNIQYLGTIFFSHTPLFAAAIGIFTLIGAVDIGRESRRTALLILSLPVAYLLFMSMQRAMLVRNLLVIAPFMALAAARGVGRVMHFMGNQSHYRWIRFTLSSLVVIMLVTNALWLWSAAAGITFRETDYFVNQAREYLLKHPENRVGVDETGWGLLAASGTIPSNVTQDMTMTDGDVTHLLLSYQALLEDPAWPMNTPGLAAAVYGPQEVNIYYYTWHGADKILLLTKETAYDLGLQIVTYP